MATVMERQIEQSEHFELAAPRSLALLVFRLKPSARDLSAQQLNDLNRRLQESVHAQQDFNMTQTVLPGDEGEPNIDCLRFAMGGLRTTEDDVLKTWNTVEELGRTIIDEA
jgi:aromatic-L-amino-acid decarboxylase